MAKVLRALVLLIVVGLGVDWGLRVLLQAPQGSVAGFGSVQELSRLPNPGWVRGLSLSVVVLVALTALRRRAILSGPLTGGVAVAVLSMVFLSEALPLGHFAIIVGFALLASGTIALLLPRAGPESLAISDRRLALGLFLLVAGVSMGFALHRHESFGSGSWDMGCMAHNFYRASRFLSTVSTVLGDVDFLGDHFMIGIWLYAPLFWLKSSAEMVIAVQSVNLALVAPAAFLIARHRGAGSFPSLILGLVTGFAFGMQSAHYFDSHEIAVGFGFLAIGVWALETGKLWTATLSLMAFALFKESLGAYVVGLGLLLGWRGLKAQDPQEKRAKLRFAASWVIGGAAWFVLVNRVLMPAFRAHGNAPEAHETFADFGPTIFAAAVAMLSDPVRALGALFIPDEKLHSMLVTVMGSGALCLLAPEILIAALPLLAERFLSSKSTMWEMGYHYAAPLAFYGGWAAACALPAVEARAGLWLEALGPGLGGHARRWVGLYLLAAAALTNAVGYRHPANFHRLEEDYFSSPPRRAANHHGIALLRALPRDVKIAAQNRLLPHLADRPYAYRLGDWEKADLILMSVGENAWPWDDGFPARLARQLGSARDFKLIFSEADTLIFARLGHSDLPRVSGPASLGLEIRTSTQSGIDRDPGPR
ncbi:MAG: DUF2079 domain-containing protein [Myxococcota bacterium]